MAVIIPSIASADQFNISQAIKSLGKWNYLHLDIEDGNFVDNISFGLKMVKSIAMKTDMQLDAHLMVTNPMLYIEPLSKIGLKSIAVHWESLNYPSREINAIRNLGMKIGIALNPRTQPSELINYFPMINYILVMTSEPDGVGEVFMESMLEKIRFLKEHIPPHVKIMVDGGIGDHELKLVTEAGADIVIMGRRIFTADNPAGLLSVLSDKEDDLWC